VPPTVLEGCRPASAADLDRLVELAGRARAELAANKGGAVWVRREARRDPLHESLSAALDDPGQHLVAGTADGAVLGYGVARLEELPDGGLLGVVDDIYVEPAGREVGIGEVVMEALVEWCRDRGCFGVDSLALPGDRHTKNFFEAFGLVARAIIVHRPLT
jgi:GNAT superfamily N-acetyltransferase